MDGFSFVLINWIHPYLVQIVSVCEVNCAVGQSAAETR